MFSTLGGVAIVAALLLAGAAQGAHHMGSTASCPAMPTSKLYANTSSTCSEANSCYTAYCQCLGLTAGSGAFMCTGQTSMNTCANASQCVGQAITCLNGASSAQACNNSNLKDLRMSIMAMEVGTILYNESAAFTACRYRSCVLVNETAGSNCTLDYEEICRPPVSFSGTLVLKGDFTALLQNATAREELASALEMDLARALKIVGIWVKRIYQLGQPLPPIRPRPARRQGAAGTLIVEFEAPGVSAKNTNFNSQLTTVVGANGNWLTSTKSAYTSLGGTGTLDFLGVSEGSGSSAFSSGQLQSLIGTPAPPTPAPPTPPGPNPPVPPPTPSSGAAMHSVLAAAVVAVLSALLF